MDTTRRCLLGAVLATPALPHAARAQAWQPTRPVRFVVPFPAGGATDVVARVLADRLQARLGQPVVVENRTGSGGNIGTEAVVRGAPDGHTLLMGTMGVLTINQYLYPSMGFDPIRDLTPVSMVFGSDHLLVVNPALPARNVGEFVALARAEPGRLSYGSAGAGSSTHMVAELVKQVAGIRLEHVPYRGSAPALNDTVAGTVQAMLDQLPSAIGMAQGGQVRALATTGARRSALLPDVPTMAEAGLPGAQASSWGAVMLPGGAAVPVVERYDAALRDALGDAAVRDRLAQAGADATYAGPAALAATLAEESRRWQRVIREANIVVN